MKILILKVFGIGNVIQSTPMMVALRQKFPDARIDVLCDEAGSAVIEGWDILDQVFVYRRCDRVIQRPGYDYYVVSRPANGWLRGAVPPGGKLVGSFKDIECWTKHESEWNMDLARMLGWSGETPHTHFQLGDESFDIGYLRDWGALSKQSACKKVVGMHVGCLASWKWKQWPLDYWARLIEMISVFGPSTVVVGGESEIEDVKEIESMVGRKHLFLNLVGDLNLKETASVIKQCDLFVSNDSGPMHIASALGVPTIGIFGPTSIIKNAPQHGTVVTAENKLPCMPCQEKPGGMDMMRNCDHRKCLFGIPPKQVFKEIVLLLRKNSEIG